MQIRSKTGSSVEKGAQMRLNSPESSDRMVKTYCKGSERPESMLQCRTPTQWEELHAMPKANAQANHRTTGNRQNRSGRLLFACANFARADLVFAMRMRMHAEQANAVEAAL